MMIIKAYVSSSDVLIINTLGDFYEPKET
jgi:hypothetical protein